MLLFSSSSLDSDETVAEEGEARRILPHYVFIKTKQN
jgi:hypothetical protein